MQKLDVVEFSIFYLKQLLNIIIYNPFIIKSVRLIKILTLINRLTKKYISMFYQSNQRGKRNSINKSIVSNIT